MRKPRLAALPLLTTLFAFSALVVPAVSAVQHTLTITTTPVGNKYTCAVDDPELVVAPGDTVVFAIDGNIVGELTRFKPKKDEQQTLRFENGPPSTIDKGKSYDAGAVSGDPGAQWVYEFKVKNKGPFGKVYCRVDPVICIPKGFSAAGATTQSSGPAALNLGDEC
jgi:hypothetical protein